MIEPREQPRLLASTDGKLYAVAMIAVVYLIAWYEVSATPRPAAVSAPGAPRAVWIDQLPAAAPPPVRGPASRPVRVRTRSS